MNKENLYNFIEDEKKYFNILSKNIKWENNRWDMSLWLSHRGKDQTISFLTNSRRTKNIPSHIILPKKGDLPTPFIDFAKALCVYVIRTKNIGYMAARNYVNECRRLYIIMSLRGESCVTDLTRWHFEETISYLKKIKYKNIFDAATNLQVVAEIIDRKNLSKSFIRFKHSFKSTNSYNHYQSLKKIEVNVQLGNDKLPSYEALVAYAKCTNNPTNNDEEILLRAIDLLIVTGMRANEVAYIPLDCWVEKIKKNTRGKPIKDMHNNVIKYYGIRYYAEKKFQDRVHWLAPQDVPFAKRAIFRLKELTKDVRKVAIFQEQKKRLWAFKKNQKISSHEFIEYLGFNKINYLHGYLRRNKIEYLGLDKSYYEYRSPNSNEVHYSRIYKAGDIENLLVKKQINHDQLIKEEQGENRVILKTSDLLIIKFQGAFRFERRMNTFKIFPEKIFVVEINRALGVEDNYKSIFERRNLTEADGSKIRLTSHQPRHWRNTIYELAGMSNVQQALAMGRQNLNQNKAYQHTSIKQKLKLHQEFLSFNSVIDKVTFLRDGIRNKTILGEITDTYHYLKKEEGLITAEDFINTHGLALHLTPFGGCTHDFSQSPCLKHLQCWNGCSHLHRTNTPGETERIQEQLDNNKIILQKMINENKGSDIKNVWQKDLEKKIKNMEIALKVSPSTTPLKLFPHGEEVTKPLNKRKNKSV